jgi:hypothetical protein
MQAADSSRAEVLPQAYAAWRGRALAGAIVATIVGIVVHGPQGEFRVDFGEEAPSPWLLLGVFALAMGSFGPGLAGACLILAAVWSWRRMGTSSRLARATWILWVLGPIPVLLVPVAHLFNLNEADSLKTSANQVRYLLTVIAPALSPFSRVPCVPPWCSNASSLSPGRPGRSRSWPLRPAPWSTCSRWECWLNWHFSRGFTWASCCLPARPSSRSWRSGGQVDGAGKGASYSLDGRSSPSLARSANLGWPFFTVACASG